VIAENCRFGAKLLLNLSGEVSTEDGSTKSKGENSGNKCKDCKWDGKAEVLAPLEEESENGNNKSQNSSENGKDSNDSIGANVDINITLSLSRTPGGSIVGEISIDTGNDGEDKEEEGHPVHISGTAVLGLVGEALSFIISWFFVRVTHS